jgi:hypothetical protein
MSSLMYFQIVRSWSFFYAGWGRQV